MNREKKWIELTSIEDLAEIYNTTNSSDYKKLIEMLDLSKQLKNIFLNSNGEMRFIKNVEGEKKEMRIVEERLHLLTKSEIKSQTECERAENKVKCAENLMKVAQLAMREAQEELKKQQRQKEQIGKEKEDWEKLVMRQKKRLKQMSTYLLVHPTASFKTLDKKRNSLIVCTKFDKNRLHFKRFADWVMDTADDEFEVEKKIRQDKEARGKFYSDKDFESAIHYVKMVVHFLVNDKEYALLYNSTGIKYLLSQIIG